MRRQPTQSGERAAVLPYAAANERNRMAAYTTAVFDLDGTLLNTIEDLYRSVNHALAWAGLPGRSFDEVRLFTGNGIRVLIDRSLNEGRETPVDPATHEHVFEEFKAYYGEHCEDHTAPYPGIPELLGRLRAAGMGLAVVSNKADFAVQELIAKQFPGAFDAVIGECEERGIRRKPDPAMVEETLRRMGRDPASGSADREGLVYIGDSEVDVATAANAQCPAVICSWGFRDRAQLVAAGATLIVDSPDELGRVLLAERP